MSGPILCLRVHPWQFLSAWVKTRHGPGGKTWPLVFSSLRHSFAFRVPAAANPSKIPVKLRALDAASVHLGQNWNATTGGYQTLPTAPFATFPADKSTASWLLNAAYAADWRTFQRDGRWKSEYALVTRH